LRRQTPITYRVHSTTSVLYGLYLFTEFGREPASVGLRRLDELDAAAQVLSDALRRHRLTLAREAGVVPNGRRSCRRFRIACARS
jgi:hypothetical protein